ncbi:MAG TPA: PKD domain-containing protein [Flavobacteriales bacterium]|nr:PKD domain-containing protein [Flavobacteriales bacterium]
MRAYSTLFAGLLFSTAVAQPCANFQACFVPSGAGTSSFFFNNCTPNEGGTQFVWSFGDGSVSTQVAPTHEFTAPGQYEVCLTAYWQNCEDSTCTVITIANGDPCLQLNADFGWTNTPNGSQFSNGTSGTGMSTTFSWSFGDGSTSNDAQPFHTYSESGVYEVCLLAISVYPGPIPTGVIVCTAEHCDLVEVGGIPPCDPNFDVVLATTGITGNVVQFVATSNHTNTYFLWNFGDGMEGYGSTESHTYAQGGTYTVCVAGWYYNELAQDSCWAESCATITVAGGDPCEGLEACFEALPLSANTFFFNNCSTPSVASSFIWDLGDGSTSTVFGPVHTYMSPGIYTVCQITTWPGGCTDEVCHTITAGEDPCDQLEACMIVNDMGNNAFLFENCSSIIGSVQFVWDFGDGEQANGLATEHTYALPGSYTACLTAYWQNCVDSTCTTVIVDGGVPCAGLEADFIHFTTPNGTAFSNTTTGTGLQTTFFWTFGDGSSSNDAQPFHTYAANGVYEACLQVVSIFELPGGGVITCVDDTCMTVMIGEPSPCDDLDAGFFASSAGLGVNFANDVIDLSWTYQWYFGDGTEGYGPNPYHTFPGAGAYQVCLVVSAWDPVTQDSCFADHCEMVLISGGNPCDSLSTCFESIELTAGGYYFENCTGLLPGALFIWDFGDGSTINGFHAEHQYDQPGTYTVCLYAYWQNCADTTCTTITVGATDPCAGLQAGFTWNTTPNGTLFSNGTAGTGFQTSFIWDFGDGASSSDAQPFHTYAANGVYEACLQVISIFELPDGGVITCVDDTCMTVVIGEPSPCDDLDAGFFASSAGLGVNFANDVITNQWTYLWYFGDDTDGDGPNPYHTYAEPGTYQVCLVVYAWDPIAQDTCFADHCELVIVSGNDPCDALEACMIVSDQGNNAFLFENCSSIIQGAQFEWDFGDGNLDGGVIADHVYAQPGTYTVCLTAFWQNCVDSTCTMVIVGSGDPCADLEADFVHFTTPNGTAFSNSTTGAGLQTTFFWTFGDGSSSNDAQPFHTYAANGVYEACLQVVSIFELTGGGVITCVDETCMTVVIGEPSPCDDLDAGFIASGGLTGMNFANEVIDLSWTYQWQFGDGTEGLGPNPYHTFPGAGTYQVCLVVSAWDPVTQDTCFAENCELIVVSNGDLCDSLVACFEALPFENGVYFFQNCTQELPIGASANYFWDFGDGSTSDAMEPDHVFAPGTYTVCLTVEQGNCADSTCTTIVVGGGFGCNPDFACTFTYDAQGTIVVFFGTANFVLDGVVWDFGDGTDGYTNTITHLYEPPGPYEVCMNAWYWNEAEQDTCWTQFCELVDLSVGLADASTSSINVFPIPAHDAIQVTGLPANTQLRLFALDGRLVRTERASTSVHSIPVVDLAPAAYVLRMDVDGQAVYRKIMVE